MKSRQLGQFGVGINNRCSTCPTVAFNVIEHRTLALTCTCGQLHTSGLAAIEEHGILAKRTGVLVHDCWAPYWRLDDSIHALCNAHLLRELLYVKETTGQPWAQTMTDFLLNANKLCVAAREQQIVFSAHNIRAFRSVYKKDTRQVV